MTQVCTEPRRSQITQLTADRKAVEAILKDAAFVLHLTQKVRGDILSAKKGPAAARLLLSAAA